MKTVSQSLELTKQQDLKMVNKTPLGFYLDLISLGQCGHCTFFTYVKYLSSTF